MSIAIYCFVAVVISITPQKLYPGVSLTGSLDFHCLCTTYRNSNTPCIYLSKCPLHRLSLAFPNRIALHAMRYPRCYYPRQYDKISDGSNGAASPMYMCVPKITFLFFTHGICPGACNRLNSYPVNSCCASSSMGPAWWSLSYDALPTIIADVHETLKLWKHIVNCYNWLSDV